MARMPTLQDFINDELLRVPMSLDLVIDAVQQRWRGRMPTQARSVGGDPARVLKMHRNELTARAVAVLRASAQEDLQAVMPHLGAQPAARSTARLTADVADLDSLALIDEADVAVDIEIARCVQAIKLQAEIVLRELQTYTSSLVNDPNVSRDTNPFRPERMVRAMWAGVQMLPMSRELMAAFLSDAAQPLASTLQQAYSAACRRLEDQGVTPASYRTIVGSGHTVWGQTTGRYRVPEDLRGLRDSFGVVPDVLAPAANAQTTTPARAAGELRRPGGPDAAVLALLARLFEAIQTDRQLAPDALTLLQRLLPSALRMALQDPTLLDRYDHALWRFMDQLAHDLTLTSGLRRQRLLGLGRNLIDHLASSDLRDSHGFAWALERLLAAQRHALTQTTQAAQAQIERLERIAADAASVNTQGMPLDIANLDTVPADLPLEAPSVPGELQPAQATADLLATVGLPPGAALRAYLKGERRVLVSLWQDRQHDLALLHEPATEQLFAVRQRAIAQLQDEGLAAPYRARSLVRRAADKVLRAM
jgi:hypothetical protein